MALGSQMELGPQPAAPLANVPRPLPTSILELFDLIASSSPAASKRFKSPMWQAWKVMLAAAFGLPAPTEYQYPGAPALPAAPDDVLLTGDDLSNEEIYKRCTGRTDWPEEQVDELWMLVGRRGGKSQIAAIISIFLAVCRDYSDELSPGETAMVMIVAPKREQTRVIFRYVQAILRMVPELNAMVADYRKTDIELTNGVIIEPQTASKATARGYTVVGLVCDEIAFWRTTDDSASSDKDVLDALKPAMATISKAMVVSLSSPYSRRGELYRNYIEHYGKAGDRVLVWRADTLSMHPRPSLVKFVTTKYEEDDVAAHAEFGAFFRTDLSTLFSKEAIAAVVEPGREVVSYQQGHSYRAFVDPSGGSSDSMTLAIAHTDRETGHEMLDLVIEKRPPFSTHSVVEEFAATLKAYRLSTVTGDAYSGEWVRQEFGLHSIIYDVSKMNRSELYLETLPLINSGGCVLLDQKRLKNQFEALERRPGRGKDVVDHPPGGHDDVANAAAGALVSPEGGSELRVRNLGAPSRAKKDAEPQKAPEKTAIQRVRESLCLAQRMT